MKRTHNIATTIANIISATIGAIIIGGCIFVLLVLVSGVVTTHEVETYTIEATITDKCVVDEYRQPRDYLLFWVEGEASGEVDVSPTIYAKYAVGDLLPIEVTVKESIYGTQNFYSFGG